MIRFNKRNYSTRSLRFPLLGELTVASTVLNDRLMTKDGGYVSKEAQYIDEQIFYFIPPCDFKLDDRDLARKIVRELR